MCPFLDEDEFDNDEYSLDSSDDLKQSGYKGILASSFFKNEKKFFIFGGAAAFIAFCSVAYWMYSNSQSIDLNELPVIKADQNPFKIKPENNDQVRHQDKIVYDNISGDKRIASVEKVAAQPEEILSLPEVDNEDTLSAEEKGNVIQVIDELSSKKEYKTANKNKVVEKSGLKPSNTGIANRLLIVEEENFPPIKRLKERDLERESEKIQKKQKLKTLVEKRVSSSSSNLQSSLKLRDISESKEVIASPKNSIMIQIALVKTKAAAEAEYKRIVNKNKFLKKNGKKIFKVDLGKSKGICYRIQVGPFKNMKEAKKTITLMKSNGFSPYIIK